MDDTRGSFNAEIPHRTNSVLSFQLEELTLENEDLKTNVRELEQKLRRTVEENEIRINVLNDKLNGLVEKIVSSDGREGETTDESAFRETIVEELRDIRLEKTSHDILEEYVGIILREKLTTSSPDLLNVNFCHELRSLEQTLDIEIFDGRTFDQEMKDEVKQVLRDKERELLISYTLEKLRDEIRHREASEGNLEELRKERERDFCVHQAINEVLKMHLGVYDDRGRNEQGARDNQTEDMVSKAQSGTMVDNSEAVGKILREHLGIENKGDERLPVTDSIEEKKESVENGTNTVHDQVLKVEKENLERILQELQDHFEKERQEWLEKLERPLKGKQPQH